AVPHHSSARSTPIPEGRPETASNRSLTGTARQVSSTVVSALTPFLNIVPDSNGSDLLVSASGVGELGGTTFVNIGIGPGHGKGSYTMTYSDTAQIYFATVTGFTPNADASAPLNITTTLGLDTGPVFFNRAYVPASQTQTVTSVDNNLQLQ